MKTVLVLPIVTATALLLLMGINRREQPITPHQDARLVGPVPRASSTPQQDRQPVVPPNIILILADDLGFSDLGCYGSEIHTPNLDYLAQNGLRYTQFYNSSRCCPTRAALLTGLYNHQAGVGKMTEAENQPGYQGHLADNTVTLAEVLKSAGYQTAMTGKWHVSNTIVQKDPQQQLAWLNHQEPFGNFSPLVQYPTHRGFDRYFGNIWGVVDYFDPFSLVSGTKPVASVPKNYYHTDAISDTTVEYIRDFARAKKPFFIYVAQTAPHWPLMAPPQDIARYKDTYQVGWEAIRKARYARMVKLGLLDPGKTKLSERWEAGQSWEANPDRAWDAQAMAVHAAMIDRMDQGIGRMISALRQTGQLANTLILFLSDNGASPENCAGYGPGFDRPNQTRDGQPIAYDLKKQIMPGSQASFVSIGPRWANVANTPYRLAKAESYEGGLHTPLVAFWPKGIRAKKGSLSHHVGHVMDFMATVVDVAGATYPSTYRGKPVLPTTGISLASSFGGRVLRGHETLFNEHFGARYARSGNWKAVSLARDTTWQLYNLRADGSEMVNLAAQQPERVRQLAAQWQAWANTHGVFPKPVPKIAPANE